LTILFEYAIQNRHYLIEKEGMQMTDKNETLESISLVSEIVAAYVSNNEMPTEELPNFIQLVHRSLSSLSSRQPFMLASRSEPAVPIEDSIHPDYIVCLEDGRKLKMLKRLSSSG
jgi:predicted transcriptional regulator